jgi:hypothetical protein
MVLLLGLFPGQGCYTDKMLIFILLFDPVLRPLHGNGPVFIQYPKPGKSTF